MAAGTERPSTDNAPSVASAARLVDIHLVAPLLPAASACSSGSAAKPADPVGYAVWLSLGASALLLIELLVVFGKREIGQDRAFRPVVAVAGLGQVPKRP